MLLIKNIEFENIQEKTVRFKLYTMQKKKRLGKLNKDTKYCVPHMSRFEEKRIGTY